MGKWLSTIDPGFWTFGILVLAALGIELYRRFRSVK